MLPFFNTLTLTHGHSTPLRSSLNLTLQLHLSLLLFRQKRHQSRQHSIPSTDTMYSPLLMLFTLLRKPSLPASLIFTKSILFLQDPSSAESHHMCPVINLMPLSPLTPTAFCNLVCTSSTLPCARVSCAGFCPSCQLISALKTVMISCYLCVCSTRKDASLKCLA